MPAPRPLHSGSRLEKLRAADQLRSAGVAYEPAMSGRGRGSGGWSSHLPHP